MTFPDLSIFVTPAPEPGSRFFLPEQAKKSRIPDQVRDDSVGALS